MVSEQDFEQLSAYIDDELTASQRVVLEARLEADPELRQTLDNLRDLVDAISSLPPVQRPRDFRLTPAMAAAAKPRFLVFPATVVTTTLSTAAAVLLLAFGGVLFARSAMETNVGFAPVAQSLEIEATAATNFAEVGATAEAITALLPTSTAETAMEPDSRAVPQASSAGAVDEVDADDAVFREPGTMAAADGEPRTSADHSGGLGASGEIRDEQVEEAITSLTEDMAEEAEGVFAEEALNGTLEYPQSAADMMQSETGETANESAADNDLVALPTPTVTPLAIAQQPSDVMDNTNEQRERTSAAAGNAGLLAYLLIVGGVIMLIVAGGTFIQWIRTRG